MQTTLTASNANKRTVFTAYNIVWFIAHLFVLLFVYTALAKLANTEVFYNTLNEVPLIKPLASFLTYAVPFTELLICAPLLMHEKRIGSKTIPTRKIGLIAGGGLMLLFTVYIGVILSLYDVKKLPCSCGGFISQLSWTAHIYFNLAFVGLAVWALLLYKRMQIR